MDLYIIDHSYLVIDVSVDLRSKETEHRYFQQKDNWNSVYFNESLLSASSLYDKIQFFIPLIETKTKLRCQRRYSYCSVEHGPTFQSNNTIKISGEVVLILNKLKAPKISFVCDNLHC